MADSRPGPETSDAPRRNPVRWLWGVTIVVNLVVYAAVVAALGHSRGRYEQQADITVENLSAVLHRALADEIEKINLTLLAVIDEIDRQTAAGGGIDPGGLAGTLARYDQRLPEAVGVRVTDADGIVQYAVNAVRTAKADISGYEHFQRMKTAFSAGNSGLVVSKPVLGAVSGHWVLVFARGYKRSDGSFGGQVHVALPINYFIELFSTIKLGSQGAVALWHDQPTLVARYSPNGTPQTPEAKAAASPQLAALLAGDQAATHYQAISGPDGVARRFFFRKIDGMPLAVNVGLAEADFLAPWRDEAIKTVGLALAFTLVTILAAWSLRRNWRRLDDDRAFLDSLLKSIPNPVWYRDVAGVKTVRNPACLRLLGDREFGAGGAGEEHVVDEDGNERVLAVSRTVLTDAHGRPTGSLGVAHDITEREHGERALRETVRRLDASNQDLEQFAYVASHDLREPLRTISSYLSLIERRFGERLAGDGVEFLAFARDAAKRMDQLVLDLLDFSRIERKGAAIEPAEAGPLVDEALRYLASLIAETAATIEVSEAVGAAWIKADQSQIVRLFQNLVSNALKYRADGRPPHLRIGCVRRGRMWEFSVEDNGIGIEPQYFERIFGIFQRLHAAGKYEGTGIGLAVCKKIVERHGGEIWLTSRPGHGSTFSFTIPASR